MLRRSTLLVVFLFIVSLGVAIYFQHNPISRAGDTKPTSTPAPDLFSFGAATIVKLKIENQEGKVIELVKTGIDNWEITSIGPAEGSDVSTTITQLSGTKILTKLDPAPPLSEMGLGIKTPANRITISLDDGRVVTVDVGIETPTKSGYYIRVDGGGPVIASRYSIAPILDYLENPPYSPTPTPTETLLPSSLVQTPFPPESTSSSTQSP